MTMDESKTYKPRYKVKAQSTPLLSLKDDHSRSPHPYPETPREIRAENEDDDGYDPYSDYHPQEEFFEDNPWD